MKEAGKRAFILTVFALGSMAGGPSAQSQAASLRLLVNGQQSSIRPVKSAQGTLVPLSALCRALEAKISTIPSRPNAIVVMRQERRVDLAVGSRQAIVREGVKGKPIPHTLEAPVVSLHGALYAPVTFARLLGAEVAPPKAGTVSITLETAEGPALWTQLLGLPQEMEEGSDAFAISKLHVRPVTGDYEVGVEMLLNLTLSRPGYVQVYQVEDGIARPLFGRRRDRLVMDPDGRDTLAAPIKVEDRLRLPLQVSHAGRRYFIALATTSATKVDLREALQSGEHSGHWAIRGVMVNVESR